MIYTPYALPSIASAIIILFLLIYIVSYRRDRFGAWQSILLMIGFFFWSFGYAMLLMHTDLDQKVFWLNLSQVGPDFTPILWLFLILEHTGRRNLVQKKWLYSAFIFPVCTTVLMWTNNWHHLLRRSVHLGTIAGNTTYVVIDHGPWYYVESIYGYIFIVLSIYLLIRFVNVSSSKKQTLAILGSMFVPVLSNLLDILRLNPLTPFGPTSIAFSITGVILAWALFRQHFLDIAPIARTVVLEKIGDGVVVLDKQHRIIDANPASYDLFCKRCESTSQLIGKEIEEVISVWPEGNIHLEIDNEARTQIELMVNDEHRFYNVTSTSIANEQHEFIGWVIIFNDITIVKQANECLQGQLDEIRKLQALLQVQVIRDSLTGCYNRHYLNEILLRESSRAKRKDETIGLMMLDIDHFKRVNDTYGHINGDRILQSLGENLRQWVRAEDMVFRYGGEEFLIVFPDIPFAPFVERAEALCKQIADWQFPIKPKTNLTVTVSVGVALFPVHQKDIYQVLECADQALYRAKRVGRNTVSVWNAADEQTTSTTENCGE